MNTDTKRIRTAAQEDIPAMIDLSYRTIRASYAAFLGPENVEAYLASGSVESFIRQNIENCTVIVLGEQIAGFCVVDGSLIDLLMIDHPFHACGLGSILLSAAEKYLFEKHTRLELESFAANTVANRFYRKHGWVEVRRFNDKESGQVKVIFVKDISRPAV